MRFCKVVVFNATFNNISIISWLSVLLVKETGVHGYVALINGTELQYVISCHA